MADHRPDPAEPEPRCVTPWRPRPSLIGGASLQIPDAARNTDLPASHRAQCGTQFPPRPSSPSLFRARACASASRLARLSDTTRTT